MTREEAAAMPIDLRVAAYAMERGIAALDAVWELADFGLTAVCEAKLLDGLPIPLYLYRSYLNLQEQMENANASADTPSDPDTRETPGGP